jgi:bifunctional enzyme CysN/CysC
MITGASWAEVALLVIDAFEGVQENSRRHGYMLSFLGIRQICVLVNKMDLVGYNEEVFNRVVEEYTGFLAQLNITPLGFIPVSGMEGDNVAYHSVLMPWYDGPTVLDQLDNFIPETLPEEKPLRIPVQDVYKFTANGDNRRIIAGRIESGRISVGDPVVFYPSGKGSTVKTIESFNAKDVLQTMSAGWSVGFTLTEQIYIKRGELAAIREQQKPETTSRLRTRLFWLGRKPLIKGSKYLFKLGTSKIEMEVESVERVLDASNLEVKASEQVLRNDIAECILKLERIAAFDFSADMPATGRFVIVDDNEISGGGVIVEALPDEHHWIHDRAMKRNEKWEPIEISDEMRAERYNQKACMVLISGSPEDHYRKEIAKAFTEKLFHEGKVVYFIGMANLLYGMDADIQEEGVDVRPEHIRRLAEIANLMMHAGIILVVSAQEISQADVKILQTALTDRGDRLITVWAGDTVTTDLQSHLQFSAEEILQAPEGIKRYLQEQGYIFRYNSNRV